MDSSGTKRHSGPDVISRRIWISFSHFEVGGSLFTGVFDSKVLNAICVSLISVSLASFSRIFVLLKL
jgi:hypothetical protein